jgi:hypothetical protein
MRNYSWVITEIKQFAVQRNTVNFLVKNLRTIRKIFLWVGLLLFILFTTLMSISRERKKVLILEKSECDRLLGKPSRRWKDINNIWS